MKRQAFYTREERKRRAQLTHLRTHTTLERCAGVGDEASAATQECGLARSGLVLSKGEFELGDQVIDTDQSLFTVTSNCVKLYAETCFALATGENIHADFL